MAEAIYELLVEEQENNTIQPPSENRATSEYLNRLSTLSLSSLKSTESEALEHDATSSLKSLQALAKRSFRSIDSSVESLGHVQEALPQLSQHAGALSTAIPGLSRDVSRFSEKYSKATDNPVLERRRKAMRLGETVDRLSDILELPTLLSSTIAASASTAASTGVGTVSSANAQYASALDLYAHIRRLQRLFPDSDLIHSLGKQAEAAMRGMTTNLILALRSQNLKLANAMRLIGLLRRIAPELDDASTAQQKSWSSQPSEGSLGALFLVCRLGNLMATLEALEPLKELADQDTAQRNNDKGQQQTSTGTSTDRSSAPGGQHTERYLKRYIEIFREQCFAIISMYKSIFPASLTLPTSVSSSADEQHNTQTPTPDVHTTSQIPSSLATFTAHLVDTLLATLKLYLPNVRDQSARDSLLTQVLYCAGSLGRLGGDFGMMLALLEEEIAQEAQDEKDDDSGGTTVGEDDGRNPEWVEAMKKHRVQASRLELLASGVGGGGGGGKSAGMGGREVVSPS